jgi:hypothetical protein
LHYNIVTFPSFKRYITDVEGALIMVNKMDQAAMHENSVKRESSFFSCTKWVITSTRDMISIASSDPAEGHVAGPSAQIKSFMAGASISTKTSCGPVFLRYSVLRLVPLHFQTSLSMDQDNEACRINLLIDYAHRKIVIWLR